MTDQFLLLDSWWCNEANGGVGPDLEMEDHDIQELAVTAKDSVIVRGGYPAPYSSPNGGEYFDE